MQHLRDTFSQCVTQRHPALITYVTAGFPTVEETSSIMLAMEAGGADIIELGLPFTDPIADGPTIQQSHHKALKNGVNLISTFKMMREARARGLRCPVVLMSYYNPLLRYGEADVLLDCKEAGFNGFIIVDLPPEEAVRFRRGCMMLGLSYIPLIAPSTTEERIKTLCTTADSFIYVVSRVGVTGANETLNPDLPALVQRVKRWSGDIPVAVGFGISTREHFLSVMSVAAGAVIGSKGISVLAEAPPGEAAEAIKQYCYSVCQRTVALKPNTSIIPTAPAMALPRWENNGTVAVERPGYFGPFGGQYVPEALIAPLSKLEKCFNLAVADPSFWDVYYSHFPFISRPSCLHVASRLTDHVGGATIFLKREDLNHTGSHHVSNALGQVLLAKRLGKTSVIADTGSGQHGVATASVCAKLGMKCIVYMTEDDMSRDQLNVSCMQLLGAQIVSISAGSLRDAANEAFRASVTDLDSTYYLAGSAIGPHPLPSIVRTFQAIMGREAKSQMEESTGSKPDAVIACVGGSSDAVGMFSAFIDDEDVQLIGVEGARQGHGRNMRYSGTPSQCTVGTIHGARTYVLQDDDGQLCDTKCISGGLNYPGIPPELAYWKQQGRVSFIEATDEQALIGFRQLGELEGILPALETSHAVWGAMEVARELGRGKNLVLCLGGHGGQDGQTVVEELSCLEQKTD